MCLRGRLVWGFYNESERLCTETIELSPNGPIVALNLSLDKITHTLVDYPTLIYPLAWIGNKEFVKIEDFVILILAAPLVMIQLSRNIPHLCLLSTSQVKSPLAKVCM